MKEKPKNKKMRLMQNKKALLGAEIVLWIARFTFLIIISIGVTMIVSALYSYSLDVRKIEALALDRKISDCISVNGYLNQEMIKNPEEFLEKCNIALNDEFYLNVTITNFADLNVFSLKYGENLEPLCKTTSKLKYQPTCLESKFYVVSNSANQDKYLVRILVAIKKFDKNLK